MKKLMISLAALTAIGAAVPAAAQTWGYGAPAAYQYGYGAPAYGYGYGHGRVNEYDAQQMRYDKIAQRSDWVMGLVSQAERDRRITPWTAQRLRQDVSQITRQTRFYGRGGLTANEAVSVIAQLDRIGYRLQDQSYGYRYGRRW